MSDADMRNEKNLKQVIQKAFGTIIDVRDERIDLNEKMNDARDMMEQAGISRKVFSMMQGYLLMDVQNREAFKVFFETIQEVLDEEFQPTLFDAEKEKKKKLAKERKAKNKPFLDAQKAKEKAENSSNEEEE